MTLPWIVLAVATPAVLAADLVRTAVPPRDRVRRAAVLVATAAACLAADPALAFGALTVLRVLQAAGTRTWRVAGGLFLTAGLSATAAVAAALGRPDVMFFASLMSVAARVGAPPLHGITTEAADRDPSLLVELAGSAVAATFVHLRHAITAAPELADRWAVPVVAWGAVGALLAGVASLGRRDLRGLWSASYAMHGGMVVAALGAAARGHGAAALFVASTLSLALGGFGALVVALEERVGPVTLDPAGGRAGPFPRLAALFGFFAAAGIAMPGTAGFVADDLLFHAVWAESPLAVVALLAASACLAIGLLRGFSGVFLGPARPSVAPDLGRAERFWLVAVALALVALGLWPQPLLDSTAAFFPPH